MTPLTFSNAKCGVIAHDGGRSYRLADWQREILLDAFDTCEMATAFNALYEAHLKAGGVPRVTSLLPPVQDRRAA